MRTDTAHVLVAAAVAFALSIAGCSSSGPDIDDPEDDQYPARTRPAAVIEKLGMAYEARDAGAYLDCLSEDLVFHLNFQGPDSRAWPATWGKAEEDTVHANMFDEGSDVVSLSLTMTTADMDSILGGDPGSNLDDRWIYVEDVDLRVTVESVPEDVTYHATTPQRFILRVDPDGTGRDGEPLWEIEEWWDLDYWRGAGESGSWTAIKCLYR